MESNEGSPLTGGRKPKIFYGWYIALAAFFIQMIAYGTFNTFGVFFNPLLDDFGWLRETISGARALAFFMMGVASIIAGRLGDRFGPRMIMAGSGLVLALGYFLMSQVNAVWQLFLFYGVIVGVGAGGADVLTLSTAARWFVKRRGMVTGIIKIGTGLGMLIMPLMANWLISAYGWRDSSCILGGMSLVFIVSAAMLLRRDPAQKGLVPYGEEALSAGSPNASDIGLSLREAIGTSQFWMVSAIFFSLFFCAQTLIVHIDPHALDMGVSSTSAAGVLSTIGGASIVSRFVMGSASDRVGNRSAIAICCIILVVALFWLQWAKELWMLYLFSLVYGFAHGGFFAVFSPLVAELFGLKSHGTIYGMVYFGGTVGGSIGPLLAGRIFDVTGNYQLAFLICLAVGVMALILSLLLKARTARSFSL